MRPRTVLLAALVGAGALLPVTPASAVCIYPYQFATGDCSPCTTGNRVWQRLGLPGGEVFFTCVA